MQLVAALFGQWQTNQTTRVSRHEVDDFRRDFLAAQTRSPSFSRSSSSTMIIIRPSRMSAAASGMEAKGILESVILNLKFWPCTILPRRAGIWRLRLPNRLSGLEQLKFARHIWQ